MGPKKHERGLRKFFDDSVSKMVLQSAAPMLKLDTTENQSPDERRGKSALKYLVRYLIIESPQSKKLNIARGCNATRKKKLDSGLEVERAHCFESKQSSNFRVLCLHEPEPVKIAFEARVDLL